MPLFRILAIHSAKRRGACGAAFSLAALVLREGAYGAQKSAKLVLDVFIFLDKKCPKCPKRQGFQNVQIWTKSGQKKGMACTDNKVGT